MRTGNRFILVGISLARVLRSVLLPSRSPHFVGSQYSLSIPPPPLGSRLTSARRARLRRWDGYRGVEGRVNEWGVNEEPAWRENSERKNDGGEVKRVTVRYERPVTYSARFVHPTHLSHLLVSLHSFREPKAVRGEEVKDERPNLEPTRGADRPWGRNCRWTLLTQLTDRF